MRKVSDLNVFAGWALLIVLLAVAAGVILGCDSSSRGGVASVEIVCDTLEQDDDADSLECDDEDD